MSNIGDDERLVVLLEARIRDFERNMQRASSTSGREFGKMQRDAKSATGQMQADMERSTTRMNQALASFSTRAGSLASAFGPMATGAAAGGAALAALVAQARSTSREIATIGDEARRAGISVKAFQELRFVADQNRISVAALTDGMKELSLRADEFIVTGSGSGAEAFRRLGLTATDLREKLKDPSALFTEIIEKLGQLDRAAQIRIADEVFGGTGGEQFVQLIDRGAGSIRRMMQDANDLGLVLDDEVIAKADEIDRQFGIIVNTVGTRLKGAIVGAADALRGFFDYFREWEDQQDSSIESRLGDIDQRRQALEARIAEMQRQDAGPWRPGARGPNELNLSLGELAQLTEEATRLRGILDQRNGTSGLSDEVVHLGEVVVETEPVLHAYGQSLVDLRARLQGNVDSLRLTSEHFGESAGAIAAARFEADALSDALRSATAAGQDGVDSDTIAFIRQRAAEYGSLTDQIEASTQAEQERQRVADQFKARQDRITEFEADLSFERSIMFLPEAERQVLSTLRGLDVSYDSFEGKRLAAGLRMNSALGEHQEDLAQQRNLLANLASTFLDAFDVASANSFFEAVLGGLADINRQLAQVGKDRLIKALFGEGLGYTSGQPEPGQRSIFPGGFPSGFGGGANDNVAINTRAVGALNDNLRQSSQSALDVAKQFNGLNERADSAVLDSFMQASGTWGDLSANDTAWCAAFANAAIARAGGRGTGSNRASSFLDWGMGTNNPQPGDIVVLKPQARGASGHVTFFEGFDPNGNIRGFGGNQGNAAKTSTYSASEVRAFRTATRDGYVDAVRELQTGQASGLPRSAMADPWAGMRSVTPSAAGGGALGGGDAGSGFRNFIQSPMGRAAFNGVSAFAGGMQSGSPVGGALSGGLAAIGMGAGPAGIALGIGAGPLAGKFGRKGQRK